MFQKLYPLLKTRTLMITLAAVEGGLVRANVVPARLPKGDADSEPALTTPLTITGTPEELDAGIGAHIAGFVDSVLATGSNLEALKAQHQAAVKAMEEDNRKKLADKRKASTRVSTDAPKPEPATPAEFRDGKPVFGTKSGVPASAPGTLFDAVEELPAEPVESQAVQACATPAAVPDRSGG